MVDEFVERDYDPKLAPMYAQMLVGMVALTGQWWLDVRKPPREEVAAHLVNLAWNGLTGLDPRPRLTASSRGLEQRRTPLPPRPTDKELREMEKARERDLKEQEKAREREEREAEKLAREREKLRLREQRELEKAHEREFRERERLFRDQEKARERELRELEKIRAREAKAAEREADRPAQQAEQASMEQGKLEPTE
jgi:hypothetical protein